jgi:hypothetical protein
VIRFHRRSPVGQFAALERSRTLPGDRLFSHPLPLSISLAHDEIVMNDGLKLKNPRNIDQLQIDTHAAWEAIG